MLEKYKNLPLRNGVGIVILNKQNKIFVAKRIDNPKNFWQMPQGGKDESENYFEAAIRELQEETSIKNVTLIKEIDDFITYLLPNHLLGIIWRGKFKGQKQKWFIMKFNGSASASEILAGALKDHKRAILIGETTYGKGSVQSIIPLKNKGAIRLTISKYYLPSGVSISEVGVDPDIEVSESSDEFRIDTESDNQLDFAVKLLNG